MAGNNLDEDVVRVLREKAVLDVERWLKAAKAAVENAQSVVANDLLGLDLAKENDDDYEITRGLEDLQSLDTYIDNATKAVNRAFHRL